MSTSGDPLRLVSTSRASDGSFTVVSEIGSLLGDAPHRLIGGVALVFHQHRLVLDHPIRATADADFGVPTYALQDDSMIAQHQLRQVVRHLAALGERIVVGEHVRREDRVLLEDHVLETLLQPAELLSESFAVGRDPSGA